jgi:hypothetical protein
MFYDKYFDTAGNNAAMFEIWTEIRLSGDILSFSSMSTGKY